MEIRLERSRLRAWHETDVEALACHANDREVWRNLLDVFPHPYTPADAREWVARVRAMNPVRFFAIELDGEAAGGIGITTRTDVYRRGGELGYWLARCHWNRGIMSEALLAATEYAFTTLDLVRVQAAVYEWNPASMRVLEKCSYEREGLQRLNVSKPNRQICTLPLRDYAGLPNTRLGG